MVTIVTSKAQKNEALSGADSPLSDAEHASPIAEEKFKSTPLKLFLIATVVPLFGVFVALALFEVGYRIAKPDQTRGWNDRSPLYYIPQNAETFQDKLHTSFKPTGTVRIASIGDSFTFAPYMQFDDAYPKRLERYLNLNSEQPKVEVINYGVPAYSTNHEIAVVKRAIAESSDLILMQITLNDPELKPYTPTELSKDKNKFGDLELTNPIFDYWQSLAFVLKRLHNRNTRKNYKQKFFRLFERSDTWGNFEGSWKQIAEMARKNNTPIIAVVFPLFGYPVDSDYPFWPLHEKVATLLKSLSIPLLDVTQIYRDIPLDRLQVLPGKDFHPNEIAHRMAAEAILQWLPSQKVLPTAVFPRCGSNNRTGIAMPGCR